MYLLGRRWETITAAAAVDMAEVETETGEAGVTVVAEATAAVEAVVVVTAGAEIGTAVAEASAEAEVAEASVGDEVAAVMVVAVAEIVAITRQTKYLLRTKSLSWVSQLTSQKMKLANSSDLSVLSRWTRRPTNRKFSCTPINALASLRGNARLPTLIPALPRAPPTGSTARSSEASTR